MRKGLWGSIAALAVGAGAAWGQAPVPLAPTGDPPPPAAVAPATSTVFPASGHGGDLPAVMPPLPGGPMGDPLGIGPAGMPQGPMYPPPGMYTAPPGTGGPPVTPSSISGPAAGYAPRIWVNGEYMLYFPKAQPVRFPLVTTSAPNDMGLLGRSSTLVLLGQSDLGYNSMSGFRISAGFFCDCDRRFGVEAVGMMTETKANISTFTATQAGILARPFIDSANVRVGSALVVAAPQLGAGSIVVNTTTQMWSVEGNGVVNLFRSAPRVPCGLTVDFIYGYRYLEFDEKLDIGSRTDLNVANTVTPLFQVGPFGVLTQIGLTQTATPVALGGVQVFSPASIEIRDSFKTQNQIHAGQLGLRAALRMHVMELTFSGKVAFGNNHQTVEIFGGSGFSDPTRAFLGPAAALGTMSGGLLANATNIGKFHHDEFVVIPELSSTVGVHLTQSLTAHVGYNFLYINKTVRPGSQINPVVNTATVPFSANFGAQGRPASFRELFVQDDFWMMGVSFGLELKY